eukprot:535944_1
MMITWCFVWLLLAAVIQGYPKEIEGSPNEWVPIYAHRFNVTYRRGAKIVNNIDANKTYCLYETENPPKICRENGEYVHVRIPLNNVLVVPTPVIPMLEYLGETGSIRSIFSKDDISSSCVQEMINDNITTSDGSVDTFCVNTSTFDERNIGVAFASTENQSDSSCGGKPYANTTIIFSDYAEDESEEILIVLAMADWIYYVACFYNKEELAEKFLENLYAKWDCLTTNINECNKGLSINPKPKVAFLPMYDNLMWKRPDPNTYYAQLIHTIKAEMVSCNQYGDGVDPLTTEELAECISNTSVCIFQADYSNLTLNVQKALNNAKCIKNDAYYDVYGDINSWFEDTRTSVDDLLSEFVAATYTKEVIYEGRGVVYYRRWLRNSTQIHDKDTNIGLSNRKCPSPESEYAAPITRFECVSCDSNFQLYSALFMLFVQLSAIAMCVTVCVSVSRPRKKTTAHWPSKKNRTDSKLAELKATHQEDATNEW